MKPAARHGKTAPPIGRVLDLTDSGDRRAAVRLLEAHGARATFEPLSPTLAIVWLRPGGATELLEPRAPRSWHADVGVLHRWKEDPDDLTRCRNKRDEKTAKLRKDKPMPVFTATDYEPVPPGLYTARLEEIEQAESVHGVYYRWRFVIEDESEYAGREVHANVSEKFGPQSKGRRWCEQMIGRPIRRGEQFDTDALIGKVYHIMVSNTPEDERGRVYDNVENVHRVRPKAGEEPDERRNGPREEEEGFNDAPW